MSKVGLTPAYRRVESATERRVARRGGLAFELPTGHDPSAPVPSSRGVDAPFAGYTPNVESGVLWQGTTTQVAGFYPFAAASGAQVVGVPIGRHLHTAEPIGLDPAQWLKDGLVTNTGIWVQLQPGAGKSAIMKRLGLGLVGFGFMMCVPGDLKDEYTPLVNAMGGQVFRIGRGLHCVNPLDVGPMRDAIAAAVGGEKERLLSVARARRVALLEALLLIAGRSALSATELLVLELAIDLANDATAGDPTIPDVVDVLTAAPAVLCDVVVADDPRDFLRQTREMRNALGRLVGRGLLGGMFDRKSSFAIPGNTPALSLSLSALEKEPDDVMAAAMLCAWAWTAAVVEGQHTAGRRRNIYLPQDELWRGLRVAPGLVEAGDRVTRLGRYDGIVSAQSTHSLLDAEALPTPEDRAKAKGLAARSGIKIIGALDHEEVGRLDKIVPFTDRERALVTSWSAPPGWTRGLVHPGRGKYLIKSGPRMGLPVVLELTARERVLYDTDNAFAGVESSILR
ncbi:hypothetical protein FGL95_30275 [Nocardiaceae bacterium YC2-7]|uniref:ATP-binding protein n=1 Tax=Antrihabitans stalactiti TaxID=2584121 RepID=A0A848KQY2_9NOCA|nr:hypothetical protein [Antrihabitans stalactiti]